MNEVIKMWKEAKTERITDRKSFLKKYWEQLT